MAVAPHTMIATVMPKQPVLGIVRAPFVDLIGSALQMSARLGPSRRKTITDVRSGG